MLNIYFNTSDRDDWIRLSPTGTNVVNNCKFFFDIKDIDAHLIDYFVVFNQINKDIKCLKEINKKRMIKDNKYTGGFNPNMVFMLMKMII
jgi:hypothetical protein